jgi:hypothetical protein
MPLTAVVFRSWRFAAGLFAGWGILYCVSAVIMRDVLWPVQYAHHITAHLASTNIVPFPVIVICAVALTVWCINKSPFVVTAVLACGGMLLSPRALYYDLMLSIPLVALLLDRRGRFAEWLMFYPFAAAVAWYFASWDGSRIVVAALLVCGLLQLSDKRIICRGASPAAARTSLHSAHV